MLRQSDATEGVDVNAVSELSGTGSCQHHGHTARRFGIAAALVAAAISLTSCAAGQQRRRPRSTGQRSPARGGSIGYDPDLANVSIQAPNVGGRATGSKFYTNR